jgi:hypothetical protein
MKVFNGKVTGCSARALTLGRIKPPRRGGGGILNVGFWIMNGRGRV